MILWRVTYRIACLRYRAKDLRSLSSWPCFAPHTRDVAVGPRFVGRPSAGHQTTSGQTGTIPLACADKTPISVTEIYASLALFWINIARAKAMRERHSHPRSSRTKRGDREKLCKNDKLWR